jgi:DNA-binding IclR family transcriptional regulator
MEFLGKGSKGGAVMEQAPVGTVERVIVLMRALAEVSGSTNLKQLSDSTGLPPSTVHRLLALLMKQRIVERGEQAQSYRVGPEYYRLASLVVSAVSTRDVAQPFMERVVQATGETCLLMRYMKGPRKVMLEHSVDGPHQLRYFVRLYQPLSLLWGAPGRTILAFLPQAEVDAARAQGKPSLLAGENPPDARTLAASLRNIREKGYAMSFGEQIGGAVGFAAPVFLGNGEVFGSLCITMPRQRFDAAQAATIAQVLCREAADLSTAFGHTAPLPALAQGVA